VTLDDDFVEGLEADFRSMPLSDQDRVMLEYVEQITKDATRISPAFHDRLRAVGFDDRGILQITLIASWFNYINRVADALGVGRSPVGSGL
jgi:alkylhydroperoxidase family enzyme